MRRSIFLVIAIGICANISLFGQHWTDELDQTKIQSGELTLYDYKNAFDDYWDPYEVEGGYYLDENGEKVKAYGWKLFKRWEWKAEHLVDAEGNFSETSSAEEMDDYYLKNPEAAKSTSGNWTNIGYNSTSGGYQGIGRVNCIAFHPTISNTFWLGAPSGGLWKTTDGGSTWTVLTDNNTVLGVSAIAVTSNYATSNTLFIGTGDRDGGSGWSMGGGNSHDNEGIGVLKSTDGGATWTNSLIFTPSQKIVVYDLLISPTNDNNLIAATGNGIYETTNGGTSWTQISTNVCTDLEYRPGSSTVFYGSFINGAYFLTFTKSGTWSMNSYILPGAAGYRTEIAVSPNNSTVVYALTVNSTRGLDGIYKSTNSGTSFSLVFNGNTTGNNLLGNDCNPISSAGQGTYDVFISANPNNANDVYVGGINVWRSTDGGSTWAIKSHWSGTCSGTVNTVHADQHCCEFHPTTNDIYLGNDGGIYKSTDNGSNWSDLSNTLTINQIYRIGNSPSTSNEILIGTQDNGTHLYSGGSWIANAVIGGDGMECLVDPSDDNIQFGSYIEGDIRRTTNHWSSQSYIRNLIRSATGATGSEHGAWISPYCLDPNNRLNLFVGYDHLWKSTDQGATSTNFSKITVSSFSGTSDIRSIAIAPSNSNYIYVNYASYYISPTSYPSSLHRSTDGGSTWTDITGTLPVSNGKITYVSVKHDDPNTVWVTLGGFNSDAVYQTTNGGSTWTNISTGLPQLPAMSIVQNKLNTGKVELYVAMSQGVWVKYGSSNWVAFSTGLPNVFCTELEIYYDDTTPSNSKIRIGTYGRGHWESDLPVDDFTANNTLPANTITTVVFTDLSTNSPTGWSWSYNPSTVTYVGGTSSTSQNPQVRFNNPGAYNVTLTTTNGFGNDVYTKSAYIHVGTPGLWTGTTDAAWNTTTNWENHMLPTSSTNVSITPAATTWPTYSGDFTLGTHCNNVSMAGASEMTVTGDLTIPSGKQITCASNSIINVEGDFVNYGTFTPGNSIVKMTGNTNASITGNNTNNGSQTTIYSTNYRYPGSYFDVVASGGKSISVNSFDVHCDAAGTVYVEVWYKSGTYSGFTSNSGAWTQLGTTQTLTSSGIWNPTNVNPGASVTIPSGSTYGFYINCYDSGSNGWLRLINGSNNYSNSDIDINTGDMTWAIPPGSGSWNGYTFNGTVYYSYVTSNPLNFHDVMISKTNTAVTTNGNLTIGNDLTVEPDAWLTNASGSNLNVNGDALFESDATGMASFIDNGTTVISGNATVQLYLTEEKWHYFTPPISDALLGVFHLSGGNSDIWVKYWDEVNEQWVYIEDVGVALNAMQGYSVWVDDNVVQDETINFTGTLNNNISTSYPLTHTIANTNKGWNHVGNPYPSALDWDATSGWTKTNIDNTVYYWNPSAGVGNYSYYVGSGSAPWSGGTSVNNGTRNIPSMQGFIVHCNNVGGGSIKIENDARIHNAQAYYKETNNLTDFLRLKVLGNNYSDEIVIRFFADAENSFDSQYDAYKLFGLDEAPQLYSMALNDELSINTLPTLEDYKMVNLGFACDETAQFIIEASELESFNEDLSIYLEDLQEGIIHNLSETGTYSFSHYLSNDPQRFIVHFGSPNNIPVMEEEHHLYIYSHEDIIYINNPKMVKGTVRIFDLVGKEIYTAPNLSDKMIRLRLQIDKGYYLVNFETKYYSKSKKLMIK